MKTILDLPDSLLIEAKAVAARRRTTLKAIIEPALSLVGPLASRRRTHRWRAGFACLGAWTVWIIAAVWSRADQVEMQNGDRYVGQVLSLNAESLVLQNEVLGKVKLPRGKVSRITMEPSATAGSAPKALRTNVVSRAPLVVEETNALPLVLPRISTNASSLQQVREQFLSDATPEAKAKFNELAGGLLTGKLSVNDIRAQAKSAADELRALKADLGEDVGLAVDGYLAILDQFLNEGKPQGKSATNAPAGKANKPKAPTPAEDE